MLQSWCFVDYLSKEMAVWRSLGNTHGLHSLVFLKYLGNVSESAKSSQSQINGMGCRVFVSSLEFLLGNLIQLNISQHRLEWLNHRRIDVYNSLILSKRKWCWQYKSNDGWHLDVLCTYELLIKWNEIMLWLAKVKAFQRRLNCNGQSLLIWSQG